MEKPSENTKPRVGLLTAIVVTALLLLKTTVLLSNSHVYGRLAMPPLYDDVAYFVDGMERVDIFRADGLRGVIASLVSSPPHAPYSTLAAFAAFLVSGGARPAPYVVNALAVAGLTLFWLVMFRVGPLPACLIAITMTATGWFDSTVTIFHPDLIAGYGAAIVASLAIFQNEVLTTNRRRVVSGALAGLVLLTKPTALPMVLTLWVVAFAFGVLASRVAGVSLLASLRRSSIAILMLVVVAGPYFAAQLPVLFRYIYDAFVTQSSTWLRLSTGTSPWTFFIFRTIDLFGIWALVGAAAFAVVAIAAVVAGRRELVIGFGGLAVCVSIAYVVPSLVPIQRMLFGGVLYGIVFITGVIAVTRLTEISPLAERASALFRQPATALTAVLLIIFGIVVVHEMKDRQDRFPPSVIASSCAEFDRIYSLLRETARQPAGQGGGSHRISAYFPTVGIPPHAYRFQGLVEGLDIYVDAGGPLETDRDRVLSSARTADIVLIPDGRLLANYFPYPVNALLGDLVQRLRKDQTIIEGSPIELPAGDMLIFRPRRS
jgi:hypothetical protein